MMISCVASDKVAKLKHIVKLKLSIAISGALKTIGNCASVRSHSLKQALIDWEMGSDKMAIIVIIITIMLGIGRCDEFAKTLESRVRGRGRAGQEEPIGAQLSSSKAIPCHARRCVAAAHTGARSIHPSKSAIFRGPFISHCLFLFLFLAPCPLIGLSLSLSLSSPVIQVRLIDWPFGQINAHV